MTRSGRSRRCSTLKACWYETFEHQPVRTSEEAAATRPGYGLQQGAKAIIVRVKRSKNDKFFVMLVFPADRKFDAKAVKDYFAARDIRFANENEVAALTGGIQPGGVPPFGNLVRSAGIRDAGVIGARANRVQCRRSAFFPGDAQCRLSSTRAARGIFFCLIALARNVSR